MDQNPTANHLTLDSFHFQERKLVISYFPGSSVGKDFAFSAGDLESIPGSEEIPWRRKWLPTPVFLPGKSYGQRSLAGYSLWVTRVRRNLVTKPPDGGKQILYYLYMETFKNVDHFKNLY